MERFKNSQVDASELRQQADRIFKKYISPMARTPVNISGAALRAISDRIRTEDISADMFSEASEQIFCLMNSDTFVRFKNTTQWS